MAVTTRRCIVCFMTGRAHAVAMIAINTQTDQIRLLVSFCWFRNSHPYSFIVCVPDRHSSSRALSMDSLVLI